LKAAIAYVFPQVNHKVYEPMARRFTLQYMRHPPGSTDHELFVVCNGGGKITERQRLLFEPLVPQFIYHNNVGRDVGAFQMAAQTIPCDLLVCIGSPARPRLDCWLDTIVRAYEDNGPGLYGGWGFHVPSVHIRTTFFWLPPQILNAYPIQVDDAHRYEFEHGSRSLTQYCIKKGFPVMQVTKRGVFSFEKFHHVEQSDSLFADQHCDRLGWVDDGAGW